MYTGYSLVYLVFFFFLIIFAFMPEDDFGIKLKVCKKLKMVFLTLCLMFITHDTNIFEGIQIVGGEKSAPELLGDGFQGVQVLHISAQGEGAVGVGAAGVVGTCGGGLGALTALGTQVQGVRGTACITNKPNQISNAKN